jgi:hypothetical protein
MSSEREDHHCEVAATENSLFVNDNPASVCGMLGARRQRRRVETSRHLRGDRPMARKKAPSNQGAVWTTKDFAAIRRLVKTGATGKTIAKKIGRSVVALYQKASIEGISLSAHPTVRRSGVAKEAKAVAASTRRRSR